METKLCYGCGLSIEGRSHYHNTVPAGATLTCRELNQKKKWQDSNARVRNQGAALNQGQSLGSHNKDLAARLAPLVIRSHNEVAKMLGLSAAGVRVIEMRALAKLRKLLLPFKNTQTGAEKIRVVTRPL